MKRFKIMYAPVEEVRSVVIVAENVEQATDVLYERIHNAGEFYLIKAEETNE